MESMSIDSFIQFFSLGGRKLSPGGAKTYFRGEEGGQKHSISRKNRDSRGGKIDLRGREKDRAPPLDKTLPIESPVRLYSHLTKDDYNKDKELVETIKVSN